MTEIVAPDLGAPEEAQQTWKSDVSKNLGDLENRVKTNEDAITELNKVEEEEEERPTRLITDYGSSTTVSPFSDDFTLAHVVLRIQTSGEGNMSVFIRENKTDAPTLESRGYTLIDPNEPEVSLSLMLHKSSLPDNSLAATITTSSGDATGTVAGWSVIQYRSE